MFISQGMFINKNVIVVVGDFNIQLVEIDGFEDIGCYIQVEMLIKEVEDVVRVLLRGKKYVILIKYFLFLVYYKFLGMYENGCLCFFCYEYFKNCFWLKYSFYFDVVFCVVCVLFVNDRSNK